MGSGNMSLEILPDDNVSVKSVPDYALWSISDYNSTVKVLILEAKTDKTISDDSVCQTIGYFMADVTAPSGPTLALVMSQKISYMIFFPYIDEGPCVDAVVIGAIKLSLSTLSQLATFCIMYIIVGSKYITSSRIVLHNKTQYVSFVVTVKQEMESEIEKLKRELKTKADAERQLRAEADAEQRRLRAEADAERQLRAEADAEQRRLRAEIQRLTELYEPRSKKHKSHS